MSPRKSLSHSRRCFLQNLAASGAVLSARPFSAFAHASPFDNTVSPSQLAADLLRPQFHLLPARNWMNDPNGPIFWNGNYHMFFQYNPGAAVWGDMHWNHAVSPDMVHWKHLPIALAPTPGGADQDGCFSGSAVIHDGVPTFIYTGVKSVPPPDATLRDGTHNFLETQCLATSHDPQLLTWEKLSAPVLLPPRDPKLTGFRDPFLWRDGATWYMGVGSGLRGEGGNVRLYRSADLRQWEFLHLLAAGQRNNKQTADPVDTGEMWECPDFFALGNKHLLFYSTERKVFWQSGELDPKELAFHPQKNGMLDYGNFYAPKSQLAPDNRRILWAWLPETRPEAEFRAAGWSGCMSLPRVLSLDDTSNLQIHFAKELQSLRGTAWSLPAAATSPTARTEALAKFQLEQPTAELLLRFTSKPFELRVSCAGAVLFSISFHPQSAPQELHIAGHSLALPARSGAIRELHLFLDASVLESITDHSIAFTTRLYRAPNSPLHLSFADSSTIPTDLSLTVWPIRPISPDRLTT